MFFALILGYGAHFAHPHIVGHFADYRDCVTNGRIIETAGHLHQHLFIRLSNGQQLEIDHAVNKTVCARGSAISVFMH